MAGGERFQRGARGLKILVLAVGKTAGPERDLCKRYADRTGPLARRMGVTDVAVREIADATGPTRAEIEGSALLSRRAPGRLIALDERGAAWSSEKLARTLQDYADSGVPGVTFVIGGADGHPGAVREAADEVLSLSAMTLPHQLARVILLEQIYRAVTLCVGHPYHRA